MSLNQFENILITADIPWWYSLICFTSTYETKFTTFQSIELKLYQIHDIIRQNWNLKIQTFPPLLTENKQDSSRGSNHRSKVNKTKIRVKIHHLKTTKLIVFIYLRRRLSCWGHHGKRRRLSTAEGGESDGGDRLWMNKTCSRREESSCD